MIDPAGTAGEGRRSSVAIRSPRVLSVRTDTSRLYMYIIILCVRQILPDIHPLYDIRVLYDDALLLVLLGGVRALKRIRRRQGRRSARPGRERVDRRENKTIISPSGLSAAVGGSSSSRAFVGRRRRRLCRAPRRSSADRPVPIVLHCYYIIVRPVCSRRKPKGPRPRKREIGRRPRLTESRRDPKSKTLRTYFFAQTAQSSSHGSTTDDVSDVVHDIIRSIIGYCLPIRLLAQRVVAFVVTPTDFPLSM